MKFRMTGAQLEAWTVYGDEARDPLSPLPWPLNAMVGDGKLGSYENYREAVPHWYIDGSLTREQRKKVREALKWLHRELKYTSDESRFVDKVVYESLHRLKKVGLKTGSVKATFEVERGELIEDDAGAAEREYFSTCYFDIVVERKDLQMTFAIMFPEFEVVNENVQV